VKRITQKEVAQRAGVSRATVSYVLNGHAKSRVPISDETRRKVLDAASKLGYQPDSSARTLRSGLSRTIGVLVPDMGNPHYWQLLTGIERAAHAEGYTLLLFHTALMRSEEDVGLRELAQRKIDGVILISSYPPTWPQTALVISSLHRPVVDLSNVDSPFDRIVSDYHEPTTKLMEYLIGLGHTRIAFVYGVATPEVGFDRLDPYREALARNGIEADEELIVRCGPTMEAGYRAASGLLELRRRPTAILAINDMLAAAVLRAAKDRAVAVPEGLSVAGFDDIPFASYLTPSLTTVHRDTERVGEQAFALLLERMADPHMPIVTRRAASTLVIRESTGPPR